MLKRTAAMAGVVGLLGLCSCQTSLTIYNDSSYAIQEIYLSPSDSSSWGRDLLGRTILYPGDSVIIDLVKCGDYDVRLIDETGAECIRHDQSLCFEERWTITDRWLDDCIF
jgi:hypothetical protein